MKKTQWGCYRDEERKAEIVRLVYEEDNDCGDKAGDVAYIVRWDDGGYSDPISRLWMAKQAVLASPIVNRTES